MIFSVPVQNLMFVPGEIKWLVAGWLQNLRGSGVANNFVAGYRGSFHGGQNFDFLMIQLVGLQVEQKTKIGPQNF